MDKGPVLAGFIKRGMTSSLAGSDSGKKIFITNWVLPNFIKKQKMAWKNWYGI